MHTSALISTLLGAGALAFPQHKHAPLHEKRDVVFHSQWQDGPHTLIQEFINKGDGVWNAPLPASTSAVVAVKADYGFPQRGHYPWAGETGNLRDRPVVPTATAAAAPEAPSVTTSSTVVQPSPVDSPPTSSSSSVPEPSGSDTTNSTTSGACNPTGGPVWSSPPCTGSSGASALDKINNLRKKWNDTLVDFAWSTVLAQASYDTAWAPTTWDDQNTPTGEGGGWVMGHHNNSLSLQQWGQCIAEGDNTVSVGDITPIEAMFLEWICEKPTAGIQDMCTATGNTKGDPNCWCSKGSTECACGHAMQINNPTMNNIGCYYMYKVAEADKTDHVVNDVQKGKELGSPGNMAPGLLTCDFAQL